VNDNFSTAIRILGLSFGLVVGVAVAVGAFPGIS
jgi:hypothetical protein